MQFHYDLTQAEPIIRDMVVVGTSDILLGAVVAREGNITTDDNRYGLKNATANVIDDVVGVTNEFYDYSAHISNTGSNAATEPSTGVSNYMKVIINPMAIWKCEYSQHADDDTVNTAADADGNDTTATFTTDREGDWIYVNGTGSTTGGNGNLYQIGLSNSTTSVTACSSYDDDLKATNTSDTFIVISNPFHMLTVGGSLDLSAATSTASIVGTKIRGLPATGAGAILVLANYIESPSLALEPLRVEIHSGHAWPNATLYADIQLMDHLLLNNTVATTPSIT